MYKDVWKRALAVLVVICMVFTVVEWPQTVKAEPGKTYHTYQYGENESAGFVTGERVAAVFLTNQNEAAGAEIFEGISFDVHLEDGANAANTGVKAELYTSPEPGNPASGIFVCSNELYNLTEGTNKLSFASISTKLMQGECFSVVLTLMGEGVSFYAQESAETQCTFISQEDGEWHDTSEDGQAVAIRAVTYDEGLIVTESAGLFERIASVLSADGTDEPAADAGVQAELELAGETDADALDEPEDSADTIDTEETTQDEMTDAPDIAMAQQSAVYAISGVTLNWRTVTVGVNGEVTIAVQNLPEGATCAWNVSDQTVAELTPNGDPAASATVKGLKEGTTAVTVVITQGEETQTLSCTVDVRINTHNFVISLSETSYVYDGQEHKPAVTVKDGETTLTGTSDYTFEYVNCVNASTAENPALVKIAGNGIYASERHEIVYVIEPKNINDIEKLEVSEEIDEAEELDLSSYITLTDLGKTLEIDKDYTIGAYETASGHHEVVVTGIGNYTGSRSVGYTVRRDIADAEITLANSSYIYTGGEIHPEITVTLDGQTVTAENYTVIYENCTEVADKPTITVTGKGNCFGQKVLGKDGEGAFAIVAKNINNTDGTASRVDIKPYPLPIAAKKTSAEDSIPEMALEYNGKTMIRGTDYTISNIRLYDENKVETTDLAAAVSGRLDIVGLANFTGTRYVDYSLRSDIKDVIAGVAINGTYTYTGTNIEADVIVTAQSGVTLEKGTDYDVEFRNNINAGTARVYVWGKGNYGGLYIPADAPEGQTWSAEFEIQQADFAQIDKDCFQYVQNVPYSPLAEEMYPEVGIVYNGVTIGESEYTVEVEDDSELKVGGNPKIVVSAADDSTNFTGSRVLDYKVTECPLTSDRIKVIMTRSYVYTGKAITPDITVIYVDKKGVGHTLDRSSTGSDGDYKLELSDNVTAGRKSAVITGRGNYTGVLYESYEITKIPLNALGLEIRDALTDYPAYSGDYRAVKMYSGNPITLDIKLTYTNADKEENVLVENTDYTLSYENNVEMSKEGATAELIIEAKDTSNYGGKIVIPFLIVREIKNCKLSGVNGNVEYTGDPITFSDLKVTDQIGLTKTNTLIKDVDFVAVYSDNNTDVTPEDNPASLAIRAMSDAQLPTTNGCYIGQRDPFEFAIVPLSLLKIPADRLSIQVERKLYEGQPVTLEYDDITAVYTTPAGKKITLTSADYDILSSYNNNDKTGTAQAFIEGKGNFTGQIPVAFDIAGKSIKDKTIVITLDESSYQYTGAEIKPVVAVKDGADTLSEGDDYTVEYKSNINAGTGKVIVTGKGNYTGTAEKAFTITPLHLENDGMTAITGLKDPIGYSPKGATQTPTVRFTKTGAASSVLLVMGEQKDYTISYTDNDKAGTATLTVNGKGNYTGSVNVQFEVEARELAENMIQMVTSWPYTGKWITPPVTVTCDGVTLENGKDYNVVYQNNFYVGSDATAEITGIANYKGTVTIPFYITDSIEDETKISITCEATGRTYTYTGSKIEPSVTVKSIVTGSNLSKGTDYTVSYANNTDVGQATITVEGIKKYSGSRSFTFYITPQQISAATATLPQSSYTYTGSQIAPKPRVTYNSKTLVEGTDYILIPGENINAGTGTVTLRGINNFAGTAELEFTIVPKSIGSGNAFATGFSMDTVEPQGYTGSEIRPTPQVYFTQSGVRTALKYGDDYSFEYSNNVNNGTARIIVKGENNYTGSVTGTFEIRANIADATITVSDVEYEDWLKEGVAKPTPSVLLNGVALTRDRDYAVSYENNTMPGEATVVVKGRGSYGGEVRETFAIYGDLSKADVDALENQPYTGSAITPVPSVNYHGIPLRSGGIDYTLSYSGNTEIGTATITLVGDGYYRGSKEVKFTIIPSAGNFVIPQISAQKYCGKQIKPEVTVYYNDKKLTEKEDYTVSYGSNTDAGVGSVTITGAGNYSNISTVTRTFAINPLLMSELTLLDSKSAIAGTIAPMEYTGKELLPTTLKLYYEEDGKTVYTLNANDYTITCSDYSNIEVGTAHITIGGNNGNIIGIRQENFEITAKNINNVTYSVAAATQTYTGKELTPAVTLRNGQIDMVQGTDFTVEYSDNINVGTAKIKLTGIGNYIGERTVNFRIAALPINNGRISVEPVPAQVYMGVAVTPQMSLSYTNEDGEVIPLTDKDYAVTYTNNTKVGTARATIAGKGNFSSSRVVNFTISQHDIGADDIAVAEIPSQAYTGKQVTPAVTITCGEYTLKQGTNQDYTLTYANNTEIGTATVTITGRGNFSGTKTVTFAIASSIENAQVTGLEEAYMYTGSDVIPEGITVSIGTTDLVLGTDYIVSYEDNRNAGTAQLVITGRGVYGGIKKIPFEIAQKSLEDSDISLNGFQSSMTYNGGSVEQDITLTYGDETLESPRDYMVRYIGNDATGTAQMIIEGTGNYKDSITKEFTIIQYSVEDENLLIGGNVSSTYTYSGSAIEPNPVLSLNGEELVRGTDYELSYENNTSVGIATMTITGINSYTGKREITFVILRRSVTALSYGNIGRQVYNGTDSKPPVAVSDAGKTLIEGQDYTLLYSNNGRPGTAVATVMGKGNYTATKTLQFAIGPGGVIGTAVTQSTDSSVSLSWTGEGIVTGYEIYRAEGEGAFRLIGRRAGTSYTDTELTSGTKYSYKVRAYILTESGTYYSDFSTVVQGNT